MEGCERMLAQFGSPERMGYAEEPPIFCLLVRPASARFSDQLTHRDFLGALMNLGVERDTVGDIIVKENCAYVFCLARIAPYLAENLTQVKHTSVRCSITEEKPEGALFSLKEQAVQVASERADAVTARAYNLSREDSGSLFAEGRVFLNSAALSDGSKLLKEGDVVSVRGFGRYVFQGITGKSKKGKLNLRIGKYEG